MNARLHATPEGATPLPMILREPGGPGASSLDVSIVIPCLNEEPTIERCVAEAWAAIEEARVGGEVLVVDNGSTDASAALAHRGGARVIHEPRRGYGRAYLTGLEHARGRTILMGDADLTYDFRELPAFISLARQGNDLVMGSRFRGRILPGAMPWHHRYIGNPILTGVLNLLYRSGVSDAHCGLRMVRADALERLRLRSTGMEFASEMVIRARQARLRIAETPITYAPRPGGSISKLKSLRDGLRHVRYMLAYAASGWFLVPALLLAAVGGALVTGVGPAPVSVPAGVLMLVAGGALAQAHLGLRLYRALALDPNERMRSALRWALTRGALAVGGMAVIAEVALAALLGETTRRLTIGSHHGRMFSMLVALTIVTLAATAWMAALRRTARAAA